MSHMRTPAWPSDAPTVRTLWRIINTGLRHAEQTDHKTRR